MKSRNIFIGTVIYSAALLASMSALAAASADSLSNHLESIMVNHSDSDEVVSYKPKGAQEESSIEDNWWLDWNTVVSGSILTEGQNCETLAQKSSITTEMRDTLLSECEAVYFYDSFDHEEGDGYQILTGKAPIHALPYGSFKKWNSYGQGAMLLKHNSIWVQAENDGPGYVTALSTIHGGTKIETRGAFPLPRGEFKLMFKLKASTKKVLPKYVGITTKITGEYTTIKHHSYVRSLYMNPYWDTVVIPFKTRFSDEVELELEDIFNGMKDRGSIVDDILLIKLKDNTLDG